jgi:hypothetical protein
MTPFGDTFKLYMRSDSHKLSIRVTDSVVDTYLLDDTVLSALCLTWSQNTQGSAIKANGTEWYVQHKRLGTVDEYVRLSVWQNGSCRDYRVSPASMRKLTAQWQLNQPLSTED